MAAPPRPSAPWQPAQFSEYRVRNSKTSFGARDSEPCRGLPLGELQPENNIRPITANAHKYRTRFTGVSLCFLVAELFPELQFPREGQRKGSRGSAYASGE